MKLTAAQQQLLQAIAAGQVLKSHRDIDGRKEYRLHAIAGQFQIVEREVVETLQDAGLIDSNKKFPAATYWLTAAGRARLG